MTYPTCPICTTPYMPLNGVDGCPWCTPDPRIAQRETDRLAKLRAANRRAEARRKKR